MRVLHGPVNVGNQPWVLSRQERQLGLHSDVVVNYNTWLGYRVDRCLGEYAQKSRGEIARRFIFGATAPLRYNVLHYYFGRSFLCWDDYGEPTKLWFWDLKLAKALGRRVVMTLQGCDVRVSAESAARNTYTPCHAGRCKAVPVCRELLDARRRDLIANILPLADRVFVLNPELVHFAAGADFLPYCVDVESFDVAPPKLDGPAVILHAPSDESVKGSAIIIEAVEKLKKRYPIEFVLVKGLPHEEALKLYRRADLVIDQLFAGWYGAFAVEVMSMAKPVACYIRDEDLGFLPRAMRAELPLVRVTPATIEADLEAALERRAEWRAWGQRARDYVFRWHHPRHIAAALLRVYQDPAAPFEMHPESIARAA
jgi:glycosyltransferase involved in cell wall biosynthesis